MDNLLITLSEVTECASRIRSSNENMYESLMNMRNIMNATDASWISEAGEAIRERFSVFASRFEKQKELIESYAAFLDMTVSSYSALETTIHANAQGMQA